jgi:ribose 5-phosphate isomerase A
MIPTLAARKALDWINDGMVVGLGTGRAAASFVEALAERVRTGALTVRAIASSVVTAERARGLGIPLVEPADCATIDVTVDGADEVDPSLDIIKGMGGALLREKVLASLSRTWIICIDESKRVERLGAWGVLPVEVVPFALAYCRQRVGALGLGVDVRTASGAPIVTDNGNHIVDVRISMRDDVASVAARIRAIPGVVETGFFTGFEPVVLVQSGDGVSVLER